MTFIFLLLNFFFLFPPKKNNTKFDERFSACVAKERKSSFPSFFISFDEMIGQWQWCDDDNEDNDGYGCGSNGNQTSSAVSFRFIFVGIFSFYSSLKLCENGEKNNDNSRQSGKIAHETKSQPRKWRADLCVAIIFFRFSFHLIVCFLFLATKPMSHLKYGRECNKYKANQANFILLLFLCGENGRPFDWKRYVS